MELVVDLEGHEVNHDLLLEELQTLNVPITLATGPLGGTKRDATGVEQVVGKPGMYVAINIEVEPDSALVQQARDIVNRHEPTKSTQAQLQTAMYRAAKSDLLDRITHEMQYLEHIADEDLHDGTAIRRIAGVLTDVLSVIALQG